MKSPSLFAPLYAGALLLACLSPYLRAAERKEVRVLFDFEDGAEVRALRQGAENLTLDIVQDNGVTNGKNCCRVVGKQGAAWASMAIRGEKLKDWARFDYFAMDVYTERKEKLTVSLELWDRGSKNYATRCTFENVRTHPGRNKLLWRINRAKRNNKEGREWRELQPKDKIQLNALKMVKLFFTPFKKGGDTVLWMDHLRLLQEDALGGKIHIKLPAGFQAFDFGKKGALTPGFTWIGAKGPGVAGPGVSESGKGWPDPLTGDGLLSTRGPVTFQVPLPEGEYWVWISAGPVFNEKTRKQPFVLKVGGQVLRDQKLTDEEFYGEQGLFRHLRTQYSQRPHALWLDYVEPECPGRSVKVKVAGGALRISASNHRLAALIVAPAKEAAAFHQAVKELRAQRITYFENQRYSDKHAYPKKQEGDGAYLLWAPHFLKTIRPWTGPSEKERRTRTLSWHAAPGQRLVARVCVTPFEDLGKGDIEISDLKGPGAIPASSIRRYYQNYRVRGTGVGEMALLPWTKIRFEPKLTWAYWFWLKVPDDAKPGTYQGTLTFRPEKGGAQSLPIALEVYPFQLETALPVSYGMYYGPWRFPAGVDRRRKIKEQLLFMREVGFTAAPIGTGRVKGLRPPDKVNVSFDPMMCELAREVGMGRHPEQRMMGSSLGMARNIARKLGLSPAVDQNPGIEFSKPELKGYYQDAIRQYREFIKKQGLPAAVEVVDEPREMPNPWNRNLVHTIQYADWIHEVGGVKTFVTPMGDTSSGKDYTPLAAHVDILSVHATPHSRRMIAEARKPGKTLWFYNTGKDRFSWGFYNWRMGSKGRWEWHWSWGGGGAEGFPNPGEWYTPFSGKDGLALRAPYWKFPGGFLFKSAYLRIAQGINDYAYLVSLEQALAAAKDDAGRAKTVQAARAFLEALKKSIPELPHVKNLASPDAGALVGAGIETPAAELCASWRRELGAFLAALQR